MKRILYRCTLLILITLLTGCEEPAPRWPVKEKGADFLKQSAERNRRLLEQEQSLLDTLVSRDTLHTYIRSESGSRYYYLVKAASAGYTPEPEDWVTLQYDLATWTGDTLYSADQIGTVRYKVDKQELFPGLRHSVKLLQAGESAVFYFPSSLAFGYHGDEDRIGPNLPVRSTLTLLTIEKNTDSVGINP